MASIDEDDHFDRDVCEHFNPVSQHCEHCNNEHKTMNREELETFRKNGPCSCESPDCWYCSAIGDFKFQWAIAKAERDIYANQLERSLEIASALAELAVIENGSFDWRDTLQKLIHEVKGEKHASEV